jgi:flagella basal body P-ring formation protein FlgA
MIRFPSLYLCVLACVLIGRTGVGADSGVVLTMKSSALLSKGDIPLGEVASVSTSDPALRERLSAINLGATPWPGNVRSVTREQVAMYLSRAGLDPSTVRWAGAETCVVQVRAHRVTGEEIVQAARDYLASLPGLREGAQIEVERTPRDILLPSSERPLRMAASAASVDRPWGRLRVYVKVFDGDNVEATVPVMFLVTVPRKIVVAARPLRQGDVIEPSHVEQRDALLGPESGPENYIEDPASVIGQRAARAVAAGTPITASMIVAPYAAHKGESVSIRLRSEHLEIVTKGLAQRDAYVGDTIPVVVETTGRKLPCRVVAAGMVELPL